MATQKNGKSKSKTKSTAKAKQIKRVNRDKEAIKIKKQQAADGLSNTRKKLEAKKKRLAVFAAEKADLEKRIKDAESEEDKKAAEVEMLDIDMQIQQLDTEMADVQAEEQKLIKELEDVEMEDVGDLSDKETSKEPNSEGSSKKGKDKRQLDSSDDSDDDSSDDEDDIDEEENAYPDLVSREDMRKGLGLTSGICKGWTKVGKDGKRPVIQIGPSNSPCFRTQKASQFDGVIDSNRKYNLTKHRRADVRKKDDTFKFTIDDVDGIQGVSWHVPDDYEGNPAEMLKPLPPKLTKQQKTAMKARGEEIPEEPKPIPVQVYIKWTELYKGRLRTFETRSGVRRLYGDNIKGDKFIYKAALKQEENYQKYLEGQRPAKEKSPTPLHPGEEETPPPEDLPPRENTDSSKTAKKIALARFQDDYVLAMGVDKWSDMSVEDRVEALQAFNLKQRS